nr:MAG TPA: SCIMP protein [Caudoviricetes sp.]
MAHQSDYLPLSNDIEDAAVKEQSQKLEDFQNLNNRANQLTELLTQYVSTYKDRTAQNAWFRHNFYSLTTTLLLALAIIFPSVILYLLWVQKITDTTAAIGLVSASAGIISSIIILPKTIAKYLFSTEEDSKNADIVKEIIKNDLEIRHNLNSIEQISNEKD